MRTFYCLFAAALVLISAAACTQGKPPQSQGWSAATGAEAYERLWWKAIQDHDYKSAEWHLAPIYTLVTSSGIRDHDQAIEYFRSLGLQDLQIGELKVTPEGADMVVTYVATVATTSSPQPRRYYMETVWQPVRKGWIAITHTETPAAGSTVP